MEVFVGSLKMTGTSLLAVGMIITTAYSFDSIKCHMNFCAVHELHCKASSVIKIVNVTFRWNGSCTRAKFKECRNNRCSNNQNETTVPLKLLGIDKVCSGKCTCIVSTFIAEHDCSNTKKIQSIIEYECIHTTVLTSTESNPPRISSQLYSTSSVSTVPTVSTKPSTANDVVPYTTNSDTDVTTESMAVIGSNADSSNIEAIIGGVIGGIVLLSLSLSVGIFIVRRRVKPTSRIEHDDDTRYVTVECDGPVRNTYTHVNEHILKADHYNHIGVDELDNTSTDANHIHIMSTTTGSCDVKPSTNHKYGNHIGVDKSECYHLEKTESDNCKHYPDNYDHIRLEDAGVRAVSDDTYNHIVNSTKLDNRDNYDHMINDTYNHITDTSMPGGIVSHDDEYSLITKLTSPSAKYDTESIANKLQSEPDSHYENIRGFIYEPIEKC